MYQTDCSDMTRGRTRLSATGSPLDTCVFLVCLCFSCLHLLAGARPSAELVNMLQPTKELNTASADLSWESARLLDALPHMRG